MTRKQTASPTTLRIPTDAKLKFQEAARREGRNGISSFMIYCTHFYIDNFILRPNKGKKLLVDAAEIREAIHD